MKIIPRVALVFLCAGLTLLAAGVAQAQTPTPTPAAPIPAAGTPSPNEVSVFVGSCWLDARPCSGEMSARINGVVCAASQTPVSPPPGGTSVYGLVVPSNAVLAGCGYEGAVVEVFVAGKQVSRTAVWHAGTTQAMVFIAGAPFATFLGGPSYNGNKIPTAQVIVPYVTGTPCGYAALNDPRDAYQAFVYSSEQQAGCGVDGSQVTFKLLDAQGNVIAVANETGIWRAWDGVSDPQQLNLTFASTITVGNTGRGDASGDEGNAWGRLSILLGFVGLAGSALGLTLRKRAAMR